MTPSTISDRAPMKQLSSMIVGIGLQRLEHAADADAAGQVDVLADLRARPDGGPGIHHRALVHVGADVHVGRHQHDVAADERAGAHRRRRHDAEAALAKLGVRVPANRSGTLSNQVRPSPAAITALSCVRKYSSTAFLIHWCVTHAPSIFSATRRRPALSSCDDRVERVEQLGRRGAGSDVGAAIERGVDEGLERMCGHHVIRRPGRPW